MQIVETYLKDCLILQPKIFKDERGYFYESFKHSNLNVDFVQENQSVSKKNVFRGFHFQTGDFAQSKLVRVVKGSVVDIVIDIRPNSLTFGNVFQIELNDTNHYQLFVPRGFAHGFVTLQDDTVFQYKCDNYYSKEHEAGINPMDAMLKIDWPIDIDKLIINDRDLKWKNLSDYFSSLP